MITGTVRVDLTDVPDEQHRCRVAGVSGAPDGARVVLIVGSLTIVSEAAWRIREHTERLHIDVQGSPEAVRRWVEVLRTGRLPEVCL